MLSLIITFTFISYSNKKKLKLISFPYLYFFQNFPLKNTTGDIIENVNYFVVFNSSIKIIMYSTNMERGKLVVITKMLENLPK